MESSVVDWIKKNWSVVPKKYKIINAKTGQIVREGLSEESEIEHYLNVRDSIDRAVPDQI